MQPSAPPPPSSNMHIAGNFHAGGGGGAAGGGAPSVVGSPFEFLDDLKRDRSNSLETLHQMLKGDELMRAAVAMEASTSDDGSYGALGGVDKRARAGSTPSMTGMFMPSHFPMGFDLASPQLTPQLTHMTAPTDYLRRDSIESLVGLGAPLSGLRRDSADGSGAHRRDSLEGLMFPGDQISDSPPAFNRSFDLYPRHGFGAVYEDVPFMDPNSPALHAMGPGDEGLRCNMDTMQLESPMLRGMMYRMQGAGGMRGNAMQHMHQMHVMQQMGYPQGMQSMHDLQLQQHYAMLNPAANPIPPPVPISLTTLPGVPQIPLVKVEINRGHDSDGDSPPNTSGGGAGGPERRLSHKEVEQRRREKAKQYFDELKSLLPPMQDTKFDKNSILVNSITLIKALRTELAAAQTLRCTGAIGDPTQCNEYHESFTRSGMCQAFAGFDGRIWEANLTFCVVLGYSALDVAHLTILSITARDDVEESRRYSGLLLSGSGQKECSYRAKLVRKDGTTLVCSIELVVLEVEGQPYCFLFTAHPPNGAGQ